MNSTKIGNLYLGIGLLGIGAALTAYAFLTAEWGELAEETMGLPTGIPSMKAPIFNMPALGTAIAFLAAGTVLTIRQVMKKPRIVET